MALETAGRARDRVSDRDRQRAATHDRIRTAALEVIGRDGLDGARVGDIAEAAGVSRGTVYFHYPKIEDIAAEVLVEAEARIGRAVLRLPSETPIARTLLVFCEAFVAEWQQRPQLFRAVAAVSLRLAATHIQARQVNAVHGVLAARFRVAGERNELTGTSRASLLAHVFLVNVLSATLAWAGRPKARLALALAEIVDIFLFGVLPEGRRPRPARSGAPR
jgi:AcrR family transcriptional regulator